MSDDRRAGDLVFFLGGHDLEMEAIRELLEAHAPGRFHDAGLWWGAAASSYRDAIDRVLEEGRVPVLVELEDDIGLDPEVMIVDHHGERAGGEKATALEQVFELLELPAEKWSRWLQLVSANDRAYLAGLREAGASREEMERVRYADRQAQGITQSQEDAAVRALESLEERAGGALLVAELPHAKTAALVDRLAPELGGRGFENLVVRSPEEVNVFGTGELITHLARAFPDGWYGGNLPEYGYFGRQGSAEPVVEAVEKFLGGR